MVIKWLLNHFKCATFFRKVHDTGQDKNRTKNNTLKYRVLNTGFSLNNYKIITLSISITVFHGRIFWKFKCY